MNRIKLKIEYNMNTTANRINRISYLTLNYLHKSI